MRTLTNIFKKLAGPVQLTPLDTRVTFRYARPDDAEALAALAQLDSSRALRGTVLVAEAGDELWAAVSLEDGHVIATPFRPSGELAFRLAERARELNRESRSKPKRTLRARPAGAGV
jgi:hypothetical protein